MKIPGVIFAALFLCNNVCKAEGKDVSVSAIYFLPAADEDYDFGMGAELQARFWMNDKAGIVLAAGLSDWIANDQYVYSSALINGMESDFYGDISGSVYMLPVGCSIVLRPLTAKKYSVCIEGGIRYVLIESDVELDGFLGTPGVGGQPSLNEELEIEDGIIGLLRADVEYLLGGSIRVVAGIGYQIDLKKGDAALFGQQTGDNELQAFFAELGIRIDI